MSVHWPIIRRLLASPFSVAMIDDRRSYRGIEILIAAMNLAAHLQSKCQSPTLGVMLPTGGGFPIVALAGWFLGKTVVPLNYLLKREELQYVIDDCGTDTVVTAGPMLEFTGFTPSAKTLIRIDQISLAGIPEFNRPALADDEDLAVLLYTSGTSGKPKGVMLTHRNLMTMGLTYFVDVDAVAPGDAIVYGAPMSHGAGLYAIPHLMAGARHVVNVDFAESSLAVGKDNARLKKP